MARLKSLIERHLSFYDREEKAAFDRARRYYQGNFWDIVGGSYQNSDMIARSILCNKNIVYAIADTAVSSLLGPNPQVAAQPRNETSEHAAPMINGIMSWVFNQNRMRRRAATTLIDAVLCKRGIFKTGWDETKDQPIIRAVDPSSLFFDLNTRDPDDIRYWLEATVVPWRAYRKAVEKGKYIHVPDVHPDRYPQWMLNDNETADQNIVRDASKYVTVWEHYDRETGIVQHYIQQADKVVFKDAIDYIPYSMYSLNQNGTNCLGLSEVQLILNQQQTMNDLLTHWKQIVYLMIPRILYDAGRITEEDLNAAVEAQVGSFVGIMPDSLEAAGGLSALFYEMPMPEPPNSVKEFIERQEMDASFVSALADAARGKVTGARTATEMAIIDAQMRTRLATREGHLNTAIEDVANKAFYLCQQYMKQEKQVRIAGDRKWAQVNHASLHDVTIDFEMVSYNPIRQNPSVMMETMINLIPIMAQLAPNVDMIRFWEEMVDGLGLPRRILMPEAEARAKQEQAQQAAQQQALGGAAATVKAAGGEEALPEEAAIGGLAPGEIPPQAQGGVPPTGAMQI